MRLGGGEAPPPAPDDEGEEITDGEAIYAVMAAVLTQASDAEKAEIALALTSARPFADLSDGARELFVLAGEELFDDDEDDSDDEEG